MPASLALIASTFPPGRERSRALGLLAGMASLGVARYATVIAAGGYPAAFATAAGLSLLGVVTTARGAL